MQRLIQYIVALSLFLLSQASLAYFPVIDPTAVVNLVKQYNQLKRQLALMKESYENAKNQLNQQKHISDSLQGHYGYGDLYNSDDEFERLRGPGNHWEETLKGLSGGNPDRYNELMATYQQSHPSLSQDNYLEGGSESSFQRYESDIKINRVQTVNATYTFDQIKEHLDRLHKLSLEIENTANTKASIDLMARITTELGYIQAQELRMQTILNQQLAHSRSNAIAEKAEQVSFNQLPAQEDEQ